MQVRIGRNAEEWNRIVEKSPYSVLYNRYELFSYSENPLPLMVKGQNHEFLFPLRLILLFKTFRLAVSPVYSYASVLPDDENALDLMSEVLDNAVDFLKAIKVDYLSLCAPTFRPKRYTTALSSWFQRHKSSVQVLYAHMIRTGNATFEEIWQSKFDKRARYNVRRAEREGVEVIEIRTEDDIHKWMEGIYQCNLSALERQGREGAYPDSYKDMYSSELVSDKKRLGEHFKIYAAIYHNRLIAYMIIQEYNKLMQVSKAMSHTTFLDKRPNDALLAHIIREACRRDVELFEYGLVKTALNEKTPSLYPMLEMFLSKYGFEEIPVFVYRLGLTRSGRAIQHLFSSREYIASRYGYIPTPIRGLFLRFYARRRRKLFAFLHT